MMKWNNVPLKSRLILSMVLILFLVLAATTAIIISTATSQQEELAYEQSIETTKNLANRFNGDMQSYHAIGRTIANSMVEYESGDRDEVNAILKRLMIENPNLIGTYVAFEPDAFDGKDELYANTFGHDSTGRFIPYWTKIGGSLHLEPLLDYDTLDYYQGPKNTKSEVITEPYLYQGELIVSYVTPVIRNDEFLGIGGTDVSLNYIDEDVNQVRIFDTGYALATSNGGIILSHPVNKEWIGARTLADFDDPLIGLMAEDIRSGRGGNIETLDPTTGKEVIMFYEPVKTGNYSFILVVPKDEMLAGVTALRNDLVVISTIALFLMGVLGYLIALSITRPIGTIVDDFKHISDDALHGKLDSRADTDVEIDFKQIPVGLNEILDRLKNNSDQLRTANMELRKYSDELAKANEQLQSLDRMKDEFLSNVSHELKTPLVSIMGYAEVMDDGSLGEINEAQKNALDTIERNSDRLRRLIDSLLYISMAQSGQVKYIFGPVKIDAVIDNVVQDLSIQAHNKGLSLEQDVAEDISLIDGDQNKLTDMLSNLVDNAIKFTPTGGSITVEAREDVDYVHISVIDTGIGIPRELMPLLFQKFYQIDSSTTRRYGGTGLGLCIAKEIAQAHHGHIWIESGKNQGTTVHIKLPK
ncbi:signal transduction histidine kinase [Methanohalophilus levihalophilus]|uniref:sensor histidine kinase n=1 Tax=Methanohalophilus levihalophilus TaxID=1431282 RepID=UPI001FD9EF85|nr:ATP-binding protein [Methanohalophilus levihalophilus]MBP2029111.1 signal transduction histidine kinase [Methanohalophilus levihalophilus]